MTNADKQAKILAVIANRGWISMDLYLTEARQLRNAGLITIDERFSVGGNRKLVWVAA